MINSIYEPGNTHPRLVVIYADGEGVLISFPISNDGVALVTSLRLSLRFWLSEDFMFIDEEVYDVHSGDLIHTIGQSPECDRDTKQWLLKAGRYLVYGMSDGNIHGAIHTPSILYRHCLVHSRLMDEGRER
jgi:hypothetical protein